MATVSWLGSWACVVPTISLMTEKSSISPRAFIPSTHAPRHELS